MWDQIGTYRFIPNLIFNVGNVNFKGPNKNALKPAHSRYARFNSDRPDKLTLNHANQIRHLPGAILNIKPRGAKQNKQMEIKMK